jgi:lantibiotic transport system ATP-binding protein
MAALTTHGLVKRFGDGAPAVDGVSITVPRRAIYGFLGANGAGKTTTLRLVLGLLRPDAGEVRLFGSSKGRSGEVGALIETPSLYPHLTGRENLDLTRRLLGVGRREIDRVLEIVDLRTAGERRVSSYSLGMRQRLGIARALIGKPRLLILDEPTNGLDPDGIRDMRELLRRLPESGDVTLIVSSHLLSEIEQVATHVGLLHRGRLLVEAEIEELLGRAGPVEVGTSDFRRSAGILAEAGFRVAGARRGELLLVESSGSEMVDPATVAEVLVKAGQSVSHLLRQRPSLEQVYHQHIALAA